MYVVKFESRLIYLPIRDEVYVFLFRRGPCHSVSSTYRVSLPWRLATAVVLQKIVGYGEDAKAVSCWCFGSVRRLYG